MVFLFSLLCPASHINESCKTLLLQEFTPTGGPRPTEGEGEEGPNGATGGPDGGDNNGVTGGPDGGDNNGGAVTGDGGE